MMSIVPVGYLRIRNLQANVGSVRYRVGTTAFIFLLIGSATISSFRFLRNMLLEGHVDIDFSIFIRKRLIAAALALNLPRWLLKLPCRSTLRVHSLYRFHLLARGFRRILILVLFHLLLLLLHNSVAVFWTQ